MGRCSDRYAGRALLPCRTVQVRAEPGARPHPGRDRCSAVTGPQRSEGGRRLQAADLAAGRRSATLENAGSSTRVARVSAMPTHWHSVGRIPATQQNRKAANAHRRGAGDDDVTASAVGRRADGNLPARWRRRQFGSGRRNLCSPRRTVSSAQSASAQPGRTSGQQHFVGTNSVEPDGGIVVASMTVAGSIPIGGAHSRSRPWLSWSRPRAAVGQDTCRRFSLISPKELRSPEKCLGSPPRCPWPFVPRRAAKGVAPRTKTGRPPHEPHQEDQQAHARDLPRDG